MTQVPLIGQHRDRPTGLETVLALADDSAWLSPCEQPIGNGLKCGLDYGHQDEPCRFDGGSAAAWLPVAVIAVALLLAVAPAAVHTLSILGLIGIFTAAVLVFTTSPRVRDDHSPYGSRRDVEAGR